MRKYVSTLDMDKDEWLRYRKHGITGTDAGAITGMNPYVSAFKIYQDKVSNDIEDIDNESMRQGRDLEAYVAQRFCEQTGKKVRKANAMFQNEEYPFMLGNFDRLVVGESAGLECKTASAYSADKWKDGKIPLHYQMQVQHYLAVSGFDRWYVAALILGREFIVHCIERDEELIRNLIIIEKRFWEEHVLAKIPPEPDGSSSYTEMLAKLYPFAREETIRLSGLHEELERREEINVLINKLEKERNIIDQKVKMQMKDSVYATTGDYNVSWKPSLQQRFDSARLKEEKPEIYRQYLKSTNSRRFMVKHCPAA